MVPIGFGPKYTPLTMGDSTAPKIPKILDIGLTVLCNPPKPIADVVFVHGLQGHPRKTWTRKSTPDLVEQSPETRSSSPHRRLRKLFLFRRNLDSGERLKDKAVEIFWPLDLLPEDCSNVRILTWGYDSHITHLFKGSANQSNISAISRDLLYALEKKRIDCQNRSILFVAHSLGGIIVKDVLYRASGGEESVIRDIFTSTQGVLFLGTPHRGSGKAETGEMLRRIASASGFSTSDRNLQALHIDSSELEGIHERFMNLRKQNQWHFEVRTFQEAKGMTGLNFLGLGEKVVNDVSSSLDGSERRQTINANHMGMCQYASKLDDGYQKVVGELKVIISKVEARLEAVELEKSKGVTIFRGNSPSQATTASSAYSLKDIERHCITLFNACDIAEYKSDIPQRVEGTCQWVLTNPQYLYWVSETKASLLWISGYPGSGKTILSAFLSENLGQTESSTSFQPTVCFFFCDEKIETQRDGKAILRSLIFQILARRKKLIRYVKSAYDIQGSHLVGNFNELWRIFIAITGDKRVGPVHVIVDAIDECEEKSRNRFLEGISTLVGNAQSAASSVAPPVKFLLTSRPSLGRQYTTHHLQIEEAHRIEDDLRLVIQTKTEGIARRMKFKPETRKYLEQALYSKAGQTFLWVTLVLPLLEKSLLASQKDLQRIVNEFPEGLEDTYERFLQSIPAKYQELASKLLHFLVGSLRPLTLEEIRILLALQDRHRTVAAVEEDGQPNILETIEGILGPMVRISDSRVSLVHQSAKEYLQALSTQKDNPLCAAYGVDPHNASMLLAQICISYLSLDDFKKDIFSMQQLSADNSPISPADQTPELDDTLSFMDPFAIGEDTILKDPEVVESEVCKLITERYTLFDYSAMHWARHFSSCSSICSQSLIRSALEISENNQNANLGWFRYYWHHAGVSIANPREFTPFTIACFSNHLASVKCLLENGPPQSQDALGIGLYWASRMGHRDVVDYLLRRQVQPDVKTVEGQTPLATAAQFDHIQVVELLSEVDITDVNYRNHRGRTPLSLAAGNGHYEVVKRLLDHQRVQPDLPDDSKWTPLFWAIGGKYLGVLKMLAADNRVEINHVDKQGRNVISWAAADGEADLVKYLLRLEDLDVQNKDLNGRNAISWAAGNGHPRTISLLLRSNRINLSGKDNKGRNAISWACSGGHHTVVQYLIDHDPAGVDEKDADGWTPLAWALDKNAPKTVGVLLASGLVNVNRKDASGNTPLVWAARYGYVDIVRMLVNVEGVEMGSEALSWATMYNHTDVISILKGLGN